MNTLWFEQLWVGTQPGTQPGTLLNGVAVAVNDLGEIEEIRANTTPPPGAQVFNGLALPGANNAHSHAFHRLLRGRTHADGGTFWTWRTVMYRAAAQLNPVNYYRLARAVYAEMLVAGYTSVAEFHYVHHQPGGTPYGDHDMERALVRAAMEVGIRLVLLDTCYLTGGIGEALSPEQARFGDGSIGGYMDRHAALVAALDGVSPLVSVGAAIHSVRAVARPDLPAFAQVSGTLHVHLSEQPAENQACVAAYGVTPTQLLAESGVVSKRLSAVHATHLTREDIALLGQAEAAMVMCPSTEADLADGIGPARQLADSGAVIALGSDQHVLLDPLVEARLLEAGERLGSGERGRFSPGELVGALSAGGAYSMGLGARLADFVVVDTSSVRTAGAVGEQAILAGTAADVTHVLVRGRVVAERGQHAELGEVARLYRVALGDFDLG